MQFFEFNHQAFVRLNGKEYFCHAAFSPSYRGYVFFTLQGQTALAKEDLPGKSWQLIHTRAKDRSHIYSIYDQSYFEYEKREAELVFVAPTVYGAKYLALKHLARNNRLNVSDARLTMLSRSDQLLSGIEDVTNRGNMEIAAVYLKRIDYRVLDLLK